MYRVLKLYNVYMIHFETRWSLFMMHTNIHDNINIFSRGSYRGTFYTCCNSCQNSKLEFCTHISCDTWYEKVHCLQVLSWVDVTFPENWDPIAVVSIGDALRFCHANVVTLNTFHTSSPLCGQSSRKATFSELWWRHFCQSDSAFKQTIEGRWNKKP